MNLEDAIRELRERNEPVPKPLRLPTLTEVATAERELGVTFHPDYRKYLLEACDVVLGTLEPATVAAVGGHTALVPMVKEAWKEMALPRELLPICEDNADYYCMTKSGEIVFWSHNGTTDEKWRDLATWIEEVWIGEK